MKSGKVWGETFELLNNPVVEFHHINVEPNTYCSKHKHEHKFNGFFVFEGLLIIEVWKNDYDLVDETWLRPGDFMAVKPGEYHRFKSAAAGAQAVELYWPELLSSDIVRESVGGDYGV